MFLLSYIPVFPSFYKLRKIDPETPRPFKVGGSDLILKMNFRTSMNITLNKNSLKEDSSFNFYDYKSDLTNFTTGSN